MRYYLDGHLLPTTGVFEGGIIRRDSFGWGETHHTLILDRETNLYYNSRELDQEITAFFDSIETNNPSASSRFTNLCRIDHLEGEGRQFSVSAPPDKGFP